MSDFARTLGKHDNNLDPMLNQGYLINIKGGDFNETIAVPGFSSISGENEITEEWTTAFNKLKANWDKYQEHIGSKKDVDNEEIKTLKENIAGSISEVRESINNIVAKKGEFGNLSKIEASVPYSRTKLLSLPIETKSITENMANAGRKYNRIINASNFKNKAQINGHTIEQ